MSDAIAGPTDSALSNEAREVHELKLLYRVSGILDQHPDVAQVISPCSRRWPSTWATSG